MLEALIADSEVDQFILKVCVFVVGIYNDRPPQCLYFYATKPFNEVTGCVDQSRSASGVQHKTLEGIIEEAGRLIVQLQLALGDLRRRVSNLCVNYTLSLQHVLEQTRGFIAASSLNQDAEKIFELYAVGGVATRCMNFYYAKILLAKAENDKAIYFLCKIAHDDNPDYSCGDRAERIDRVYQCARLLIQHTGSRPQAIELLQRAVALSENNPDFIYQCARLLIQHTGSRPQAIEFLNRAIALSANNPDFIYQCARLLDRAIALSVDNPNFIYQCARLLIQYTDSRPQAIEFLNRAIVLSVDNPNFIYQCARLLIQYTDSRPQAIEFLNRAIVLSVDNQNFIYQCARLLIQHTDSRLQAIYLLQRAVALSANNPDFIYRVMKLLFKHQCSLSEFSPFENTVLRMMDVGLLYRCGRRALFEHSRSVGNGVPRLKIARRCFKAAKKNGHVEAPKALREASRLYARLLASTGSIKDRLKSWRMWTKLFFMSSA